MKRKFTDTQVLKMIGKRIDEEIDGMEQQAKECTDKLYFLYISGALDRVKSLRESLDFYREYEYED